MPVDAEAPWDAAALHVRLVEALDRYDITGGIEEIWLAVRRLNQYVEESAPWQLAKDDSRAGELDRALASLIEGVRVIAVLLHPYLPDTVEKLQAALGTDEVDYAAAGFGARRLERVEKVEQLFPRFAPA